MKSLHLNINLSLQQLIDVVKQLSPDEKLKLNEAIWSENMDIPQEHQKLVLDRVQKSKQNPDSMLDWDKASKKLKP
ncbi:addiction module protein [Chryseosolibacter indicus]|uniref:Addiction module protein n=1 Tax=Chryseosolibacter indicus TaxID=2782351 RepID=A0ABS5VTS5_9BACT|nr:addiction module protein [Chryseosolibacter indicus]MBT1704829.1 addiction module protein [Chryseosolibacter indicus]